VIPAIADFRSRLASTQPSTQEEVASQLKATLAQFQLKMPALAMPIRYALFATTQTPALDAVIAVMGKDEVIERLSKIG
jgi:glutamyl-tRNA synthetase